MEERRQRGHVDGLHMGEGRAGHHAIAITPGQGLHSMPLVLNPKTQATARPISRGARAMSSHASAPVPSRS